MSVISEVVKKHETELISEWLKEMAPTTRRSDLLTEADLKSQAGEFIRGLAAASESGTEEIRGAAFTPLRELLGNISRQRAMAGFSPSETAMFVFSFKKTFATYLTRAIKDPSTLISETWRFNNLIDQLGLYTTEVYLKSREDYILRQQQDMLELSTPVVRLWEGVLALPLIGTLDSARTQVVMESLLKRILETNSQVAIIDITGVPTVDTLVAQHLLKTVTAARLMGADCIISGIRPQIAQTIVHLGVNLADITTKASMADAFLIALQRNGYTFVKKAETA